LLPGGLQKAIVIAGIVYFELVLVSLLVLFFYLLQARFRYPFLSFERISNTWPWFYYASVSPEVPRAPVQTPRERFLAACLYGKDLVRFANNAVGETEQEELRVEIQQYFLLLAYQGYVHQFSLRLTNIFFLRSCWFHVYRPCAVLVGDTQMKKNVGQLTYRALIAGIIICLTIGILVYRQFSFAQRVPPQDSTATRLKDLEKKNMEIQTKLDQVQESLNQIQSKTTQGGPAKPGSKKHH
jgi:hypothetical protein